MVIVTAAATAAMAGATVLSGTTLALVFSTICLIAVVISMTHQHQHHRHHHHHRRLANFPGGPHRVPLLGNIPSKSSRRVHQTLSKIFYHAVTILVMFPVSIYMLQ